MLEDFAANQVEVTVLAIACTICDLWFVLRTGWLPKYWIFKGQISTTVLEKNNQYQYL